MASSVSANRHIEKTLKGSASAQDGHGRNINFFFLHLTNGHRYEVAIEKVEKGVVYGLLYSNGRRSYEFCQIPVSEIVMFSQEPIPPL